MLVHARAGVAYRQHDVLAGRGTGMRSDKGISEVGVGGCNRKGATPGHGVTGIHGEIHQRCGPAG